MWSDNAVFITNTLSETIRALAIWARVLTRERLTLKKGSVKVVPNVSALQAAAVNTGVEIGDLVPIPGVPDVNADIVDKTNHLGFAIT